MTSFRRDRGRDPRGNTRQRRARKRWLLSPTAGWGGDGETVPCWECGVLCGFDDDVELIPDRIVPGENGGTYDRANLRPHCALCSCRQGQRRAVALMKQRRLELTNGTN